MDEAERLEGDVPLATIIPFPGRRRRGAMAALRAAVQWWTRPSRRSEAKEWRPAQPIRIGG